MAIEYAISAGEGTLIDYGVCVDVAHDGIGPAITKYSESTRSDYHEFPCDDMAHDAVVTVITANCPYNCETGR